MAGRFVAYFLLGLVVVVVMGAMVYKLISPDTTAAAKEAATNDNGRFQVIRTTADQIILLDTTSGDLYKAGPDDIQPYSKLRDDDEESTKEDDEPE